MIPFGAQERTAGGRRRPCPTRRSSEAYGLFGPQRPYAPRRHELAAARRRGGRGFRHLDGVRGDHALPAHLRAPAGARLDVAVGRHRLDVLPGHAAVLVAAGLAQRHGGPQAGHGGRRRALHRVGAALHHHHRPALVRAVPVPGGRGRGGLRPRRAGVRGGHHHGGPAQPGLRLPDHRAVRRAHRRAGHRRPALPPGRARPGRLPRDLLLRRRAVGRDLPGGADPGARTRRAARTAPAAAHARGAPRRAGAAALPRAAHAAHHRVHRDGLHQPLRHGRLRRCLEPVVTAPGGVAGLHKLDVDRLQRAHAAVVRGRHAGRPLEPLLADVRRLHASPPWPGSCTAPPPTCGCSWR